MEKNDVGRNAGRVWQILAEKRSTSIRKIGELTHWSESHIFMALGWLARENKIRFNNQNGILYVELV
ncbi:winged helix-turn-helix domain-containing protein [Parabacteroides sp. PF5-9]|uniref:winged helix-turn-helix domain-containing protein n=1 Tax=Parabacteroides sp. PF5-9 TaxID=1742404 RepID=UPI00247399A3|nr:winged helix-turn-helix domain-containing protein [Parabacteroides sp. PF5-9]MDH6357997.1 hypothetical protein [Parabacteroides sp. PF5-9]